MMDSEYVGKLSVRGQAEAPKIISGLRLDSAYALETKSGLLIMGARFCLNFLSTINLIL